MKTKEAYQSNILDDFIAEITPDESEKVEKRMLLAVRIDEGIKAKGWKKKDFAEALNKRPSEITKWLSGTHNFNSDTLFDIERVLSIELVNVQPKRAEQITYSFTLSESVKVSGNQPYPENYRGQSVMELIMGTARNQFLLTNETNYLT